MNIAGISSNNSDYSAYDAGTALASKSTKQDPRITNLKEQIQQKEQSIKNIEDNDKLTDKEKTEKKKTIQDEIAQLNQQLAELQSQIEKEEKEKEAEKLSESNKEQEKLQKTDEQKEIEKLTVPENLMETMVTAQTAMSQSGSLDYIKTKMEGEARTAASDAKRNASLGVESSYQESVAADSESTVTKITGMQLNILGRASEEMEKSAEEQFEERQEAKAEERIHDKSKIDHSVNTNDQTDTTDEGEKVTQEGVIEAGAVDTLNKSMQSALDISDQDSQRYLNNVVYKEIDVLL